MTKRYYIFPVQTFKTLLDYLRQVWIIFTMPSLLYSEMREVFLPLTGSVGILMIMTGGRKSGPAVAGEMGGGALVTPVGVEFPVIAYSSEKVTPRQ